MYTWKSYNGRLSKRGTDNWKPKPQNFELKNPKPATKNFELATKNFELATGNFELATGKLGTLNSNPTFGRYP
jgi:hypothetical protein